MISAVEVSRGSGPVVLGLPHTGTRLPKAARARLNERGRSRADTDWHLEKLYAGLLPGITTVRATFHRYLLDANRPPDGASLYPGRTTTALCPLTDFDGHPIHREGAEPDATEIVRRRADFHEPYHAALAGELERVRARHGVALLLDAHSIRSRIPFLFEGTLAELNLGTASGASCSPRIEAAVADLCADSGYTWVVNGRFRGGWTTRHHGRPGEDIHALQLELAQSTYLAAESPPWEYDVGKAERLRGLLRRILAELAVHASESADARADGAQAAGPAAHLRPPRHGAPDG
jgi:N-formylglutamate deformylase